MNKFNLLVNTSGQLIWRSNGNEHLVATADFMDNQWHHIAIAANRNSNTSFIVDGVLRSYLSNNEIEGLDNIIMSLGACKIG